MMSCSFIECGKCFVYVQCILGTSSKRLANGAGLMTRYVPRKMSSQTF